MSSPQLRMWVAACSPTDRDLALSGRRTPLVDTNFLQPTVGFSSVGSAAGCSRIWSTDWIRNPDLQIRRILAAYEMSSSLPHDSEPAVSTYTDIEFDDLQPEYVVDADMIAPTYVKIDDVPTQQIIDTATRIVTNRHTCRHDRLVRTRIPHVSRARIRTNRKEYSRENRSSLD